MSGPQLNKLGNLIKILLVLTLFFSVVLVERQAFAQVVRVERNDEAKNEAKNEVKKSETKQKGTYPVDKAPPKGAYKAAYAAYMAAKKACLKEDKNLRRNKLKECIIAKTK